MDMQLHKAAEKGNLKKVKELLNQGANIHARTKNGFRPIHWAAAHGHLNIVKELLNRGAKINSRTNTGRQPIFYAAERSRLPVVKELLNRGANANNILRNNLIHKTMKNAIREYIEKKT